MKVYTKLFTLYLGFKMWTAKWLKDVYNINRSYFWVVRQVVVSLPFYMFPQLYFYNDKKKKVVCIMLSDVGKYLIKALQLTVIWLLGLGWHFFTDLQIE